ncbi:SatD family protein [Microbacterium sp. KR10-403]|uniref:SatD family protein n=1 Tax=Microbacterium sp. KR10-403 TaxID=3158581 RepID=UPI0032E370CD
MAVAVIVDIVGSRRIADRASAQRAIDGVLQRLVEDGPPVDVPLHPIVGDEMQGVYPRRDAALLATLLVQLALPDGIECRFGIGLGEAGEIPSASGGISEGTAWWAARAAVEDVEALAARTVPSARTRVARWSTVAGSSDAASEGGDDLRMVNAYLLARDHLVTQMSERTRRLTYGRCMGATQRSLAEAEGITQSAVSQALTSSGANAVVEGFRALRG